MRTLLLLLLPLLLPITMAAQSTLIVDVVLNKPEAGGQLMLLLCPSK